ncbi:hypothetical protein [Chryseomicrobium excrementi]|uniref:hypothetical protein n=1 Tax=Chryseomicrobium excrementi TaxID=2041346 RepID=UPI0013FE375F|nr:hypothetical protein [Chryseomicrobium excrementi]
MSFSISCERKKAKTCLDDSEQSADVKRPSADVKQSTADDNPASKSVSTIRSNLPM